MPCERAQQLEAYLDGELDAAGAAEVERHLETCCECR
jgi:anti-sigma factor RsiW